MNTREKVHRFLETEDEVEEADLWLELVAQPDAQEIIDEILSERGVIQPGGISAMMDTIERRLFAQTSPRSRLHRAWHALEHITGQLMEQLGRGLLGMPEGLAGAYLDGEDKAEPGLTVERQASNGAWERLAQARFGEQTRCGTRVEPGTVLRLRFRPERSGRVLAFAGIGEQLPRLAYPHRKDQTTVATPQALVQLIWQVDPLGGAITFTFVLVGEEGWPVDLFARLTPQDGGIWEEEGEAELIESLTMLESYIVGTSGMVISVVY